MRNSAIVTILTSTLLVVAATDAGAQWREQRFTFDIRAAYAFPTGDFVTEPLASGPGFGATVAYQVQPHLHVYGGWDWMHFSDESGATAVDVEETGYTFGLHFERPLRRAAGPMYRVELGGTYKHAEVEDADGDLISDSGHSLGFEAGLGLLVPTGGTWMVAPMVRFRSLSPEFDVGATTTEGTLRYVALEFGFVRRF